MSGFYMVVIMIYKYEVFSTQMDKRSPSAKERTVRTLAGVQLLKDALHHVTANMGCS